MINFFSFLIENRVQFVKDKYAEKGVSTEHDEHAEHRDHEAVVDHISNHADPSKNKAYTGWLTDKYHKGQFKQEDSATVHTSISNFEKYKPKLEKKDINQYKALSEVDDAVRPHLGTASTNKEKAAEVENTGRSLIHDTGSHQVYKLHTKEASQKIYGGGDTCGAHGTNWCTAARSGSNMFDRYHEKGGLYPIHIHGDEKSPYQLHMHHDGHISEFSDRHNHSADQSIIGKVPGIKDHPEFAGKHPMFDSAEKIHAKVNDYTDHNYVKNSIPSLNKEQIHSVAHKATSAMDAHGAESDEVKPHKQISDAIVRHPDTSSETLDHITDHQIANPEKHKYAASPALHANISKESSMKLLGMEGRDHGHYLTGNKNTHPDVLEHMHKHMDMAPNQKEIIAGHANLSHEMKTHIMTGKNALEHQAVLSSPTTHPDMLSQHADNPLHHAAISTNPAASGDTLRKIHSASDNRPWIHENLAKNKSTPHDILQKLGTHEDKDVSKAAKTTLKSLKVKG